MGRMKLFITLAALLIAADQSIAARQALNENASPSSKGGLNSNFSKANANFIETYAALDLKSNISCFASEASFNGCFGLEWQSIDASGFNGNLATTDNTLQEIAQKVDDLVLGSGTTYTAGSNITISPENVISATGTLSGTVDWDSVTDKPTETAISASIVTELFPGTGDCLGKNGQAVDCGGDVTEQSADPTSASAEGWYVATGSGDIFYKSSTGLFKIAGSYVADPVTYTLTVDGTGWNGIDLVYASGTTLTADGSITVLSGDVSVTCTPDTGRSCVCDEVDSNTWLTGASSPYIADMTADRTIACTFADSVSYLIDEDFEGIGNPGSWYTEGGMTSGNFDYTTLPISGSQSLYLTDMGYNSTSPADTITAGNYYVAQFGIKVASYTNDIVGIFVGDPWDQGMLVRWRTGDLLRLQLGSSVADTGDVFNTGEVVWIRIVFKYGTGTAYGAIWTSSTETGTYTKQVEITNGTSTNVTKRVGFYGPDGPMHVDNFKTWQSATSTP